MGRREGGVGWGGMGCAYTMHMYIQWGGGEGGEGRESGMGRATPLGMVPLDLLHRPFSSQRLLEMDLNMVTVEMTVTVGSAYSEGMEYQARSTCSGSSQWLTFTLSGVKVCS